MEFFLLSTSLNNKNNKNKKNKILQLIPNSYLTLKGYLKNIQLRNLPQQNIYGSSFKLKYYYTNLYFGEKMQKQGLILDTGSSITTA